MNISSQCPDCAQPIDLAKAHADEKYAEEFDVECPTCTCVFHVLAKVLFITLGDEGMVL